jgi:hypothetical protein
MMRFALSLSSALVLALAIAACGEKDEPEVSDTPVAQKATTTTDTSTDGGGKQGGGDKQGGGGEGGGAITPEDEVKQAVIAVVGGGDPAAVCRRLVTQRYLKRTYGNENSCINALKAQGGAFGVKVSNIELTGTSAEARAVPQRGPNKGERIRVKLVREGGVWKVDSQRSNAPAGP